MTETNFYIEQGAVYKDSGQREIIISADERVCTTSKEEQEGALELSQLFGGGVVGVSSSLGVQKAQSLSAEIDNRVLKPADGVSSAVDGTAVIASRDTVSSSRVESGTRGTSGTGGTQSNRSESVVMFSWLEKRCVTNVLLAVVALLLLIMLYKKKG